MPTTKILTELDLAYIDGHRWRLREEFRVLTDTLGLIVVPAGFITDFNSVPRLLTNIFQPTEFGEAAVPHDQLYQKGTNNGIEITRGQADAVHKELLEVLACPSWRVESMYLGLRLRGWHAWNAYRNGDHAKSAIR